MMNHAHNQNPPNPAAPHGGHLAIGLETDAPGMLDRLARRLTLEFGTIIARQSLPGGEEQPGMEWLAFDDEVEAGRLIALRQHADRVERLMAGGAGGATVRLDVLWVDASRAVRAVSADAPHRVPLGHGVFAEVVATAAGGAGFLPAAGPAAREVPPEMLAFFEQVSAAGRP